MNAYVLAWDSSINADTFQLEVIPKVNEAIANGESASFSFLADTLADITSPTGLTLAKRIAQEISDTDGEIADSEVRFLEYVKAY